MGLPQLKELYNKLDESKKLSAISFLRAWIPDESKEEIRKAIVKDPIHWIAPHHFFWGMGIRNSLRDAGYGEKFFGINNLDDCYVELIEEAVNETPHM